MGRKRERRRKRKKEREERSEREGGADKKGSFFGGVFFVTNSDYSTGGTGVNRSKPTSVAVPPL